MADTKISNLADGAAPQDADLLPVARSTSNVRLSWLQMRTALSSLFATAAQGTDAREWTAATVSQAEAEAGTATTRRAWTAERVRQAIAAWWAGLTVSPSKVTMATARLLGRTTAGSGGAEEISIGSGLSLSSGVLSATGGGGGGAGLGANTFTGLQSINTPNTRFLQLDPAATGETINFGWLLNTATWSNGGVSGTEVYKNDVVQWGFNVGGTVAVPGVAGKPQLSYTMENKFYDGVTYGSESHQSLVDTAGLNHRFESWYLPHNGGIGSSYSVSIDKITYSSWNDTVRATWNLVTNEIDYASSFRMRFNTNNVASIQQRNAAGTLYLDLPYIDNNNRLLNARPTSQQAPVAADNILNAVQFTGAANNTTVNYYAGNTVTGGYVGDRFIADCTGIFQPLRGSNSNAAASAHTRLSLEASGGDAFVYLLTSAGAWVFGNDASASGNFVWGFTGANLGSADRLTLTSTGKLTSESSMIQKPEASLTLTSNGQLGFEATSNTQITVRYRGSDGVTRSTVLTLS